MELAGSSRPGDLGIEFRVGDWLVQPVSGLISSGGSDRHLRRMLMDLLVLLAENAGLAVSKADILDRVWKSRFVGESALTRSVAELRQLLGDSDRQPRYIETVPKCGYRLIARVVPGRQFAKNRLAILPFSNLSGDPEQEYLADGVADLVTTELARIASLRVISRQSVLHLKESKQKLTEIGRELDVDAIVEGSVFLAGDRLRITAQLVRVEREQHLWAASYECELADILKVQAQVARAVAEAIRTALTPADLTRLAHAPAVNAAAQEAYLKARYYFVRGCLQDLQRGIAYLESAIEKAPEYAPAWAELAEIQGFLGFWGFVPHQQATAKMREVVGKALALDDGLGEAHVTMAWLQMYDWHWDAAEREFRRALELNPSSVGAHFRYGMFLAAVRADRAGALAEADCVLSLDPLSPYGNSAAGYIILLARNYERAVAQASLTLEMYPYAVSALYVLGCAKLAQSKHEEAAAAFEKVGLVSPEDSMGVAMLGHAHARLGRREAALKVLNELHGKQQQAYVPDMNFVFLYAGLGDMDRAFAWLEKCYQEHEPRLFSLGSQPIYDPLRRDARFADILRRLGLPGALAQTLSPA